MDVVYYASACLGYVAFVYLSERVWPFSAPRGSVAARRFRKGRAVGLLIAAISMVSLALLLMPTAQALPVATAGATVAVLISIRLRQILRHAITRHESPAAHPAGATEHDDPASTTPTQQAVPSDPQSTLSEKARRAIEFLQAHRPDIVLDGTQHSQVEAASDHGSLDFSARPWTSKMKFEAVVATFTLDPGRCRRFAHEHGLSSETLAEWRTACELANEQSHRARIERAEQRVAMRDCTARIDALTAELARKDRALAETATDLMLRDRRTEHAS